MRAEEHASEGAGPQQFGVIDLFAIMTLAAFVSAMAAPFLRGMQTENLLRLLMGAILQFGAAAVALFLAVRRRRRLLESSGRRIGIAYCGQIRWRLWPVVKSVISMLLLAAAQVGLALLAQWLAKAALLWIYQLQLGAVAGLALARFLWRVYPNTMEFFEHGVALRGLTFIPWAQVDLRPSQYFADRLVVVHRPSASSIVGDTKVVQVAGPLRERLLATFQRWKQPGG